MLREAQIILPQATNDGAATIDVQTALVSALVVDFGGCTTTQGVGHWFDGTRTISEPVYINTVAMQDNSEGRAMLANDARVAGHRAGQACMYVRHANGEVEFIDNTTPTLVPVQLSKQEG